MSLQELCRVSEIPHNKIQVSTAGRLQNSGFDIALDVSNDQAATHHSLTFTEPVEESELEKFIRCFDEPIPNPTPKRKPR